MSNERSLKSREKLSPFHGEMNDLMLTRRDSEIYTA